MSQQQQQQPQRQPLEGAALLQDALTKFKSVTLPRPSSNDLALFNTDYKWIAYLKPEYTLFPEAGNPDRALLGKGGFGSAYRVKSAKNPSEPVRVVKVLQKRFLRSAAEIQHLCSELAVAGFIHHDNLNHRTGLYDNDTHIFIILELCAGPRPDVLTRIAHVIARRRPDRIPQIEEIHRLWKTQAANHGIDPNNEEAFGNYVDGARLMPTLVPGSNSNPEIPVASDLLNFIIPQGTLREPTTQVVMRQIMLGLGHLHQCFVVHRDMKIDNVVVAVHRKCELKKDAAGRITSVLCIERFEVKIIDFGLVKYMCLNDSAFGTTLTPNQLIHASHASQEQAALTGFGLKHDASPLPSTTAAPPSSPAFAGAGAGGANGGAAASSATTMTTTADANAVAVFGNFAGFGDLNAKVQMNKEKADSQTRFSAGTHIERFVVACTPDAGTVIYSGPQQLQHVATNGLQQRWITDNEALPRYDCFSSGIICYCATQGKTPFQLPNDPRVNKYAHLVAQMQRPLSFSSSTSELAKDLMVNMMRFDVKARFTTAECLEHPFLRKVGDTVVTEFFPNQSNNWCRLERDIVRERREQEAEERKKAVEEAERQQRLQEEEEEKAKKRNASNPLVAPTTAADDGKKGETTTTTTFADQTEQELAEEFQMQNQVISMMLMEEDVGEKENQPHAVKPRATADNDDDKDKDKEKDGNKAVENNNNQNLTTSGSEPHQGNQNATANTNVKKEGCSCSCQ